MATNMKRLFLEADEISQWVNGQPFGTHETWCDHGQGLLVTLANQAGYPFDVMTLKAMHSWAEFRSLVRGYDLLVMNVRSWRYIYAKRAAEIFKRVNPNGQVWVGGMHTTVALPEMEAVPEFDVIVKGEAEGTWLELLETGGLTVRVNDPDDPSRAIPGSVGTFRNLDDLPFIDRAKAWPRTPNEAWPLEGPGGWGPGKRAATMMTQRMCPFHCSFCFPAERNHFQCGPRRRSVDNVLAELEYIEQSWGDFGTVVFHEGEFLQHPKWLGEFLEKYPRTKARPFWAACRADLLIKWKPLSEALIRDANWHTISVGLESGNDDVLKIMNKGTTAAQNLECIEFINDLGDRMVAEGKRPPVIFANVMLATPGETREAAFDTVRMLGRIKRNIPSLSLFTPYPGSTLGNQIIAEGRSLDTRKRYLRFPDEAKVAGIDYSFYQGLFNGQYDRETGVNMREMMSHQGNATEAI